MRKHRKFVRGDMCNTLSIYPFFSYGCVLRVFEGTNFFLHTLASALAGGVHVNLEENAEDPR